MAEINDIQNLYFDEANSKRFPKLGDTCYVCNIRPSTQEYYYDSLAMTHGMPEYLCEQCMLQKQLNFAYAQRDRISELEARMDSLSENQEARDLFFKYFQQLKTIFKEVDVVTDQIEDSFILNELYSQLQIIINRLEKHAS